MANGFNVRAMMRVVAINPIPENEVPGGGTRVVLHPVADTEGKYKDWSKYTPSGECRLDITNPSAAGAFESGKLYQVDFTPAD